ncbi:flagellin protein FlaA [Peptococcaceae bacterium]|nr:flagellin protein FlaA [Peptococcaceae bacterium]
MIINHNIPALNTYRHLTVNNMAMARSLEKLSSGLRINRAADDAAGLAISEKMRSQIRGLEQAARNAQDTISLIQTAEGGLNETHAILQRMRVLAVQATTDTYTAADRAEIQREIEQLRAEVDRIAGTTEFNTKKLLNGMVGATASVDPEATNIRTVEVVDAVLETGTYNLAVSSVTAVQVVNVIDGGTGLGTATITIGNRSDASFGVYQLRVEEDLYNVGRKKLTLVDRNTGEVLGSTNNVDTTATGTRTTIGGISFSNTAIVGTGTVNFEIEGDANFILRDAGGNQLATVSVTDHNRPYVEIKGLRLEFNADLTAGTATITITNNALVTQVGASERQTMRIAINDMSARALGVDEIDVMSAENAGEAITAVDGAIQKVSAERSRLGAYQNRLEHTISNLNIAAENLTAAESRIRDVDMAKEMMEFTRASILNQAATAMLAQANQMPQVVLQLLR